MPGEKLIQTANIWLSCTNYDISSGLLWWISLVHWRGLQTAKILASVEKSENWNMESWLGPLRLKHLKHLQLINMNLLWLSSVYHVVKWNLILMNRKLKIHFESKNSIKNFLQFLYVLNTRHSGNKCMIILMH